jgi:polysaccharide export outer membrane protein
MMKDLLIVTGFAMVGLAGPALALQGPVRQTAAATGASDSARDKLRIEVHKDQQLSQSVQVRPDGKITLPLIGDLEAAGQLPIALLDSIAQALREYVTNRPSP